MADDGAEALQTYAENNSTSLEKARQTLDGIVWKVDPPSAEFLQALAKNRDESRKRYDQEQREERMRGYRKKQLQRFHRLRLQNPGSLHWPAPWRSDP